MRALFRITLVATLLAWCGFAQRGGGGHGGGGGGFHGGGGGHATMGGGGFRGGGGGFGGGRSIGGGFGNGAFNRGGFGNGFNRGGFGLGNRGYGYRGYGGWGGYGWGWGGWGYPYWGLGWSYWPGDWDYGWDYPYYGSGYGYGYDPGAYAYNYNTAPDAPTGYYPQIAAGYAPPATATARPVIHSYDQYGQEVHSSDGGATASPIYLIAMKDGTIRAASSYSVENGILHFVTLQHEEQTVPIGSIDRTLTNQLNRERRVNLNLGQ